MDTRTEPNVNRSSMARVLITGAQGFTGRYLVKQLLGAGYDVVGAKYSASVQSLNASPLDVTSIADCRSIIEQFTPSYIVHLAASTFVGDTEALEMYRVNVLGTLNLLQACEDVGWAPRKILIPSSANVYGNRPGTIAEDAPFAPVNHYGASKAAMEYMLQTWFHRLPIIVTRPFNYTGVGQERRFLVPKITGAFGSRQPCLELGNLDVARDFSDVRTIAQIYQSLLEGEAVAEAVNVCSEQPYTLQQILDMAQDVSGHRLEIRVNPQFVRLSEVKVLAGSAKRLRELIPGLSAIPFFETIRWMIGNVDALSENA